MKPAKRITYGDISHLLEAEGFVKTTKREHASFEHAAAGTSLVLPVKRANASASPMHIAMTRLTLSDFGILSQSDFDKWVANPKRFQVA
jgi:predicted RNA binding protein YcfA (HicA-like mRNA interferase family)